MNRAILIAKRTEGLIDISLLLYLVNDLVRTPFRVGHSQGIYLAPEVPHNLAEPR